ncbi:BNR domain-containing protein [Azotobacter vinelandii CA]|uniref:BNR domain-containing protein n=2 Tax=Azotobacter vinelandii TaxID=354 RepID=C1DS13_AZOVD|nr:hypothetical protein [Azotobacter vinelandii]ACO79888.1 BNR domain-containing protein [Azotobacter vinelandii DJ]AGK16171.1 BNR domain-containing protein [Azotobacter vinelandii CA]AGK21578.1 BNR domain-containing protein [Azotobacter vinelandii CA6]SFX44506.1 hypothetical protein SAMN04244547_01602 [Azotobacter vinelandii]GLK62302.1 hypothetical protein GCM10017624_44660 [Azotobacter vinelandii]
MPISLLTQSGQESGWVLGETRRIAAAADLIDVGESGKAVKRDVARAILASEYPDFYNLAVDTTTTKFFATRTATGLTGVNGINTSGAGVWIATGPAGGISRSTNGGVTWTAVTSGVTATLGQPSYGGGKWVIPYATNKVLISADDGASWTDTTVQGSFSFSATGKTAYLNGAFVYSDLSTKLYRSTDGVNWSDVGDTARGGGTYIRSLAVGQGLHVILVDGNLPRYSSDGGVSWSSGASRGITDPGGGLYWTGQYWVSGGSLVAAGPITEPAPSAAGYAFSLSEALTGPVQRLHVSFTATGQSGANWTESYHAEVICADGAAGAVLKYGGYGTGTRYLSNADLLKLLSGQSPTRVAVSGGPSSVSTYGVTEEGSLYALLSSSNQLGLRTPGSVVEMTLDAYAYTANQVTNANWYTRIK